MSILSFYNKILHLGSLTADVEGAVSSNIAGAPRPYTVGGKRMYLPTREVLVNPDKSKIVIFHPLSENMIRGESEVMQSYRNAINLTLNYRLTQLLGHVVELAASPGEHKHLKPTHLHLITILKDADQKTFDAWEAIANAMPAGDSEHCIVHIFIKKNAKVGSRDFRRAAIVSFPLYEELTKEGSTDVFGVKLRKKDHAALKGLLEATFPNIAEKGSYSRGGDSEVAPSLDALLKAVQTLAGQANAIIDTFQDVKQEMAQLTYEDDWTEEAFNLDLFDREVKLMPMQVGNEGTMDGKTQASTGSLVTPSAAASASGTIPMPSLTATASQAWMGGPAAAPASVVTDKGMVDYHALMSMRPDLNYAPPVGMGGGNMYPNMQYPGMGYGYQQSGAQALRSQGASWSSPMAQFAQVKI
jgi:hypothetical protein